MQSYLIYSHTLVLKVFGWINKLYGSVRHRSIHSIKMVLAQNLCNTKEPIIEDNKRDHTIIANECTLYSVVCQVRMRSL